MRVIITAALLATIITSTACPPPDEPEYGCALYPPGVCWCGPGCGNVDDPPDVGCEPVDPIECEGEEP